MSADEWVCIFVLFVVSMRRPEQGAAGGWVMPGLVFQWFSFCEFSLFASPWGLFSCSLGLGVSAPTPKAQGLILSFAWVYIFFSTGQILLSALSCSACTSVSEDVFLMYL